MVIGIDVAVLDRAFHGVALEQNEVIEVKSSLNPREIQQWCLRSCATVVAINGPSHWAPSMDEPRTADRQLKAEGLTGLVTPPADNLGFNPESIAHAHRFFGMIAREFPLYQPGQARRRVAIETRAYPCLVALSGLAGKPPDDRAAVMRTVGFDLKKFGCTESAAITAFAAQCFAKESARLYGDAATGIVAVPDPQKVKKHEGKRLIAPEKIPCSRCYGQLWVCEDHPHRPFADCPECGGGVGMACVCNPAGSPGHGVTIASVFGDQTRN